MASVDCVYEFITKPDDTLTCRICLAVARNPWQHGECGMLFCEQCKEKYGRDKPCPYCKMEQPQYFKDGRSKRDIKALPVSCGCYQWEGTIDTLDDHVTNVCQCTPVPCPNECKDGRSHKVKFIMKRDLERHLKECPNREHQCEYCRKKDTYVSIMKEHDKICEKKKVPCINKDCHETIERGMMDAHVAHSCQHTEMYCRYKSIGCSTKMKRRDKYQHESDYNCHLSLVLYTMVELKKPAVKTMTFKLPDFQKKEVNNECFASPSYTSPTGYHMYFSVYPNGYRSSDKGSSVSVMVHIKEGKYDEKLNWPLIGKVYIELLNQLEDEGHRKMWFELTAKNDLRVGGSLSLKSIFIPHSQLPHNPATGVQYLKDDTLYFRVSVEVSDHKPWLECTTVDRTK